MHPASSAPLPHTPQHVDPHCTTAGTSVPGKSNINGYMPPARLPHLQSCLPCHVTTLQSYDQIAYVALIGCFKEPHRLGSDTSARGISVRTFYTAVPVSQCAPWCTRT